VGGQVIDLAVVFWLRVDTRAYPIFAITADSTGNVAYSTVANSRRQPTSNRDNR